MRTRSASSNLGSLAILALALAALAAANRVRPTTADAQGSPRDDGAPLGRAGRRDATVRAVERAGPAVANIATERVVVERFPPGFDEFFREFLGRGSERRVTTRSLGSGILVDPDGYVVTNAHVVQRATKIVATLPDEREFEAQLVSLSPLHDLALLKIDATAPLPFVKMGTSSDLMPGETVIALGNPFGLENTVTRGVISARDRRIRKDGRELEGTFIQTDAAINPGNSGGPLLNLDAELVGVNTAVHAGGQGIGFAIPVDRVRKVITEISSPEEVREIWLGLTVEEKGGAVLVARVEEGGPADKAGLRKDDVIEAASSVRVGSVFEWNKAFLGGGDMAPVRIAVRAPDGSKRGTQLVPTQSPARLYVERRLGVVARDLTPALAWRSQPPIDVDNGVLVRSLVPNGPAAKIKMSEGDVVTKVGKRAQDPRIGQALEITRIGSVQDLAHALESVAPGTEIAIFVLRGGRELRGELTLP
jgi:serine protease Do